MNNWFDTVISQYANSPVLIALLETINDWIDPSADIDNFYDSIWNIDTANDFGLNIWGRIVVIDRVVAVPSTTSFFGFNDGAGHYLPFNSGAPFRSTSSSSTQNFTLSTEAYRSLILIKAAANISDCSAPSINALLSALFTGRGRCYTSDYGNMQMGYTFEFYLLPYELAIIEAGNVLPRPAAVGITINQAPVNNLFGFQEAGPTASPFNVGVFNHR